MQLSVPPSLVVQGCEMDDALDFIDFADVLQHGDPAKWRLLGQKPGSGVVAHSDLAPAGTRKIYEVYEVYEDEFGVEIEVHYFRHLDGSLSGVKVTPRS